MQVQKREKDIIKKYREYLSSSTGLKVLVENAEFVLKEYS